MIWIAEDLSLAENGVPYGPGLDEAGIAPEHLIRVATSWSRDVLWAMEEALRCRPVDVVIGELRTSTIDQVATRRLALAAAVGNTLGLVLRTAPDDAPSAAATRWIIARWPPPHCRPPTDRVAKEGASDRRAWPPISCAIATVISEHGSWSGTVWSSVSSSQRILSLWLERFSTDRIARQSRETSRNRPSSPSAIHGGDETRISPSSIAPVVVFGKRGNLDLLVAVDAAAERLGLTTGLALAQARAMHPALVALPEDQAADARLLAAVADWCQRYTPLVAADPPDGILLDIGGCVHLFGGEERLCGDLLARMTDFGFSTRIAIATTIGAAWAAARFSDVTLTEIGSERELLAPLPVAALRLPADMVAALARLGLKRVGDILDLPRAPLAARFGVDLLRKLDRALGREDEPLSPLLPVAPYVAERNFHEPITREEDVLAIVERLASRLATTLAARGAGARRLELTLFRTDGMVKRIAAGTSRPCAIRGRSAPCSSNGSPRSARRSTPVSASIWCDSRCSWPNRVRTSRSVSAAAKIRRSSTAWSTV